MVTLASIASTIGIRGFVALGLAAALAFVCWRADTISEQRDDALQAVAMEKAAHAVTLASLDQLQARLEAYVKDGAAREKAGQEALRAQENVSKGLDRQIDWIRSERSLTPTDGVCETPQSVLQAEGL